MISSVSLGLFTRERRNMPRYIFIYFSHRYSSFRYGVFGSVREGSSDILLGGGRCAWVWLMGSWSEGGGEWRGEGGEWLCMYL